MDNIKKETMIKEIKTIYSGRIKTTNPLNTVPHIASMDPVSKTPGKSTFFNSVINKLNIIVEHK